MTTVLWIVAVLASLVVGIGVGRYTAPGVERSREMESERDEAHAELQRYREDVRSHFEKTANLFNAVTGSYRELYEHLAEGSDRLGTGPSARMLETRPEERTLQGPEEGGDDPQGTPDPASEPASEEGPSEGESHQAEEAAGEYEDEQGKRKPEDEAMNPEEVTDQPETATEETGEPSRKTD